jgi:molybdopterin synthase sulfur carrier subunit
MSPSTTSTVATVRLVYLARLREAFASPGEVINLPAGVADVADLLALLRARGGAWQAELAPGRAVRVAVNHDVAALHTPVSGEDEIALFPPVTGG